jgi:hypothetical protein
VNIASGTRRRTSHPLCLIDSGSRNYGDISRRFVSRHSARRRARSACCVICENLSNHRDARRPETLPISVQGAAAQAWGIELTDNSRAARPTRRVPWVVPATARFSAMVQRNAPPAITSRCPSRPIQTSAVQSRRCSSITLKAVRSPQCRYPHRITYAV